LLQEPLARSAAQQVVTPEHVGDALICVVDDDREVVCGNPIVSLQYDIVGSTRIAARHSIMDGEPLAIGA
jgi:hypothetical protein